MGILLIAMMSKMAVIVAMLCMLSIVECKKKMITSQLEADLRLLSKQVAQLQRDEDARPCVQKWEKDSCTEENAGTSCAANEIDPKYASDDTVEACFGVCTLIDPKMHEVQAVACCEGVEEGKECACCVGLAKYKPPPSPAPSPDAESDLQEEE